MSTPARLRRSRFSNELHYLRERLNSIDLSNIKKLARLGEDDSSKSQKVKLKENKES